MKKVILYFSFLVLGAGAGYLIAQNTKHKDNTSNYIDEIIKKHIEQTQKMEQEIFDSMFDDNFFSRDYNPFAEIEKFRKRMEKILGNSTAGDIFNDSLSKWLKERIADSDFSDESLTVKTQENDEFYTVEIENKDPSNSALYIDVKSDYIKITKEKKSKDEKEDKYYKSQTSSYFKSIRYFHLPRHIAGKDHYIESKGNKIIIKFKKNV